jgi:hypothetical protein
LCRAGGDWEDGAVGGDCLPSALVVATDAEVNHLGTPAEVRQGAAAIANEDQERSNLMILAYKLDWDTMLSTIDWKMAPSMVQMEEANETNDVRKQRNLCRSLVSMVRGLCKEADKTTFVVVESEKALRKACEVKGYLHEVTQEIFKAWDRCTCGGKLVVKSKDQLAEWIEMTEAMFDATLVDRKKGYASVNSLHTDSELIFDYALKV